MRIQTSRRSDPTTYRVKFDMHTDSPALLNQAPSRASLVKTLGAVLLIVSFLVTGCKPSDLEDTKTLPKDLNSADNTEFPKPALINNEQRTGPSQPISETTTDTLKPETPGTHYGLFYSPAELKEWNQRRQSGPYKQNWDNRIMRDAQLFMTGKKDATPWSGRVKSGCHPGTTDGEYPGDSSYTLTAGMWANSAAFVYRVLHDAGETDKAQPYFEKVKTYLMYHLHKPGIDFRDHKKWCYSTIAIQGVHQFIAAWFRRIAITYSWIKEDMTLKDRSEFEQWLLAVGKFYVQHNEWHIKQYLKDPYNNKYECAKPNCTGARISDHIYSDGPPHYQINDTWNNRGSAVASAVGIVGIVTGDAELIYKGKTYFQEALTYSVWPDGTYVDIIRAHPTPANAFSYPMDFLGSICTLADALAREGDSSLYDYATRRGIAETAPKQGEPDKTIRLVITHLAGQVDGTIVKYGTGEPHTQDYIINPQNGWKYGESWADLYLIQSNLYYQNNYITGIYTRTGPGTSPRGSKSIVGWDQYTGDWGTYPDVEFMWAGLEGKVWPYPTKPNSLPEATKTAPCHSVDKNCSFDSATR